MTDPSDFDDIDDFVDAADLDDLGSIEELLEAITGVQRYVLVTEITAYINDTTSGTLANLTVEEDEVEALLDAYIDGAEAIIPEGVPSDVAVSLGLGFANAFFVGALEDIHRRSQSGRGTGSPRGPFDDRDDPGY